MMGAMIEKSMDAEVTIMKIILMKIRIKKAQKRKGMVKKLLTEAIKKKIRQD